MERNIEIEFESTDSLLVGLLNHQINPKENGIYSRTICCKKCKSNCPDAHQRPLKKQTIENTSECFLLNEMEWDTQRDLLLFLETNNVISEKSSMSDGDWNPEPCRVLSTPFIPAPPPKVYYKFWWLDLVRRYSLKNMK